MQIDLSEAPFSSPWQPVASPCTGCTFVPSFQPLMTYQPLQPVEVSKDLWMMHSSTQRTLASAPRALGHNIGKQGLYGLYGLYGLVNATSPTALRPGSNQFNRITSIGSVQFSPGPSQRICGRGTLTATRRPLRRKLNRINPRERLLL